MLLKKKLFPPNTIHSILYIKNKVTIINNFSIKVTIEINLKQKPSYFGAKRLQRLLVRSTENGNNN